MPQFLFYSSAFYLVTWHWWCFYFQGVSCFQHPLQRSLDEQYVYGSFDATVVKTPVRPPQETGPQLCQSCPCSQNISPQTPLRGKTKTWRSTWIWQTHSWISLPQGRCRSEAREMSSSFLLRTLHLMATVTWHIDVAVEWCLSHQLSWSSSHYTEAGKSKTISLIWVSLSLSNVHSLRFSASFTSKPCSLWMGLLFFIPNGNSSSCLIKLREINYPASKY